MMKIDPENVNENENANVNENEKVNETAGNEKDGELRSLKEALGIPEDADDEALEAALAAARESFAEEDETAKEEKKKESDGSLGGLFCDLFELVAISLATVMLLLTFFIRHSPVNGSSMYPTIEGRDNELQPYEDVLLISDLFYTPDTGDIVVIQTPTLYSGVARSLDHALVKRVIAVGGDTMTIDFANWKITVNGEVIEEGFGSASYVNYPKTKNAMSGASGMRDLEKTEGCTVTANGTSVYTVTIPEGSVFVMGDNRNNSLDSRSIGLIDERWIVGRALLRVYPFDRIGTVE